MSATAAENGGAMEMTDFEKQVLSDLAELKTEMRSLLGDGQPGRMQHLEDQVERHERFVQRAGGMGTAMAALITMAHMAVDYLRVR